MDKINGKIDFEQIVRQYQTMVFRTAIGFVHTKEDAEDITQDVFLRAYRSWDNFRADAAVSTWLYRITVNLSLNHINSKNKRGVLQIGEDLLSNLLAWSSGVQNPHQQMEQREQDDKIAYAIDSLPDKQRTAFVLSRYDDLPQKEISAIMGVTEGAVEQLLMRAKANLQKKLERTIGKSDE